MQKRLSSCCFRLKTSTTDKQYLSFRNYFGFCFLYLAILLSFLLSESISSFSCFGFVFFFKFSTAHNFELFLWGFFAIKNHKKHLEHISNCIIRPAGLSDFCFPLSWYYALNVSHCVFIPDCFKMSRWNYYTFVPGVYIASLINSFIQRRYEIQGRWNISPLKGSHVLRSCKVLAECLDLWLVQI